MNSVGLVKSLQNRILHKIWIKNPGKPILEAFHEWLEAHAGAALKAQRLKTAQAMR
jgi:hypothetical protein